MLEVKDVMTKDVICVDKDVDLRHVLKLMKKHEITKIPVVVSLMGLDAFPHDNPFFFGCFEYHFLL